MSKLKAAARCADARSWQSAHWLRAHSAQAKFPNHPIRLLVPFAPGGGVDVVARIVGQKLSERIGQPILVESKPGAGRRARGQRADARRS